MSENSDTLLISGEFVITSAKEKPLRDSAVAVKDGFIQEIGPAPELMEKYQGAKVVRRPSGLIAPGLINCHTHAPMVLFRGVADDIPLKKWLEDYIFPAEAQLNRELIRIATQLACAEMIRSGTTTFVDMYFFEREMAKVVDEVGMRAYLGEGIFDFPSPAFPNVDKVLDETADLVKTYKDNSRINFTVDPHTPYTCSSEILVKAAEFARSHSLPIVIHLSETRWEQDEIRSIHGATPVKYLDNLGLLGPDLVAVHCVWLDSEDITLLKYSGASVVHCPESNLKLGSGISPTSRLLEAGINVALGTDGAASNNNLDMFGEMDFAAKLPKGIEEDPSVVTAEEVLKMATASGAQALGAGETLGRLEPGYMADLIILDLDRPHLRPCYNPVSQMVYAASMGDVTDVMVEGKFLMENSELLTIDEERLLSEIKSLQNRPFWKE